MMIISRLPELIVRKYMSPQKSVKPVKMGFLESSNFKIEIS